jgi:hypothetical protein
MDLHEEIIYNVINQVMSLHNKAIVKLLAYFKVACNVRRKKFIDFFLTDTMLNKLLTTINGRLE